MKRIIVAALLSLMLWTGASVAANAADVAERQDASAAGAVADSDKFGGMTESEAYRIRMAEIEKERQQALISEKSDAEDVIFTFTPIVGITVPFIFAF